MRYKIDEHGIGGREETWYYAEYDPATGKAFLVKEWDNIDYRLNSRSGVERTALEDAKADLRYQKAAEAISKHHPEWQPL